jgi:MSHA pilin protein MshD
MSSSRPGQSGLTLIELIVFIVIVSVGLVGILSVLNVTVFRSSDPLLQKQAQALAEGLLEEIQLGYFAYCDGGDAQVIYAQNTAACTGGIGDSYGPESGETRPYNSVKDYVSAANTDTAITATDLTGTISGPSSYTATVRIDDTVVLGTGVGIIPTGNTLLIRVTVSGPGGSQATAEGYRTRLIPK